MVFATTAVPCGVLFSSPGCLCIVPILPAMPNLCSCTASRHPAHGTSHLVCVKPQEVPVSPFFQLVEVLSHPQLPTIRYQHQCMVGCAISPSPIFNLVLAHASPTDVFSCLGWSPRQPDRDGDSGSWDVGHPEPLLTCVGWAAWLGGKA